MTEIDIKLPRSWQELEPRELKYVYELLTTDMPIEMIATRCFVHWSGLTVLGKSKSGNYVFEYESEVFEMPVMAFVDHLAALDWLRSLPTYPVRLPKLQGCAAISADLQGVPFETYIIIDNLYQGYLATKSDALLDQMATVLYPGLKKALTAWQLIAVFYWVASLKDFFARKFSDFLKPASNESNLLGQTAPNVEEAMNAQIRALTKGDVTKEKEVLSLDTWRALTELNAQAKEYKELNAKLKQR